MSKKVALITGGARGIGEGIAKTFLAAGYKIMISDIGFSDNDEEWAYKMADLTDIEKIKNQSPGIEACFVDVTNAESCADAVKNTIDAFGQLDVLVNNAGVVDSGPIESLEESTWDRIFSVNTKGIFLMTKASLPDLRKSKNAAIINTASIAGKKGYPNMSAYCGSKFAAIGITQSLASELASSKIRVNAICPGMVGTAMWTEHLLPSNASSAVQKEEEFKQMMEERIPLGTPQTVDDMGEAALFLATSKNITGVALSVSGGYEMN
jgi:meso-butanediol dehydrogenase/(S,S)-butanediol dehydrogenase/diacetyl reductase